MTDVHNKEIRSFNMRQIRSSNTKPELVVRKYLFSMGYRYRINYKKLPGKPDIILPKLKTVIFVNGCFWHGHKGCSFFSLPKTRTKWWKNKIELNIKRDEKNQNLLRRMDYRIIVIWECDLKSKNKDQTLKRLSATLCH